MAEATGARRFGPVSVVLVNADITTRLVDAIVNAANDRLSMGGGVAGAIRSAGGMAIHLEAIAQAPAPLGSVVRTGAGELLCDFVYHAVVIRFDLKGGTSASNVREVVRNVLRRVEEDEVGRIALPLFGAGVGGLSVARSLETILEAFEEFAALVAAPLVAEIVVLDAAEFEQAKAAFDGFRVRVDRDAYEAKLAADYLEQWTKKTGEP